MKGIKIVVGEKNENILFKDSIDEQTAYQLVDQYMLAQCTSVIPNDFSVILKEKLKEKGITGKTGIIYQHNGIPQYSDNDSISPNSAFRTHIKMLVSVSAILSCCPFFILIFLPCIKMNHYGFSRKSIWKNLETFP